MDLRKLKTLIDLVSESNVSELEITEAEGRVRIVKGNDDQVVAQSGLRGTTAYRFGGGSCCLGCTRGGSTRSCGGGNRTYRQIADGWHVLPLFIPRL